MGVPRVVSSLALAVFISTGCSKSVTKPPPPAPTEFDISGAIATSQTWSGTVRLNADADIAAGVTIHIAAGTVFQGAQGTVLRVHGTLSVDGTGTHQVTMQPKTGATTWGGIVIESGGAAGIHNATGSKVTVLLSCKAGALACVIDSSQFSDLGRAVEAAAQVSVTNSDLVNMSNGCATVAATGDLTITDSIIHTTPGDLVVVSGGELTVSFCDIGSSGSQHGDIFVTSASALSVTYTNLASAVYGLSIGGTNNAVLQYNNFLLNDIDVGDLGSNVAVNLQLNYWDSGAPALGGQFSVGSASLSPIVSAGPRR